VMCWSTSTVSSPVACRQWVTAQAVRYPTTPPTNAAPSTAEWKRRSKLNRNAGCSNKARPATGCAGLVACAWAVSGLYSSNTGTGPGMQENHHENQPFQGFSPSLGQQCSVWLRDDFQYGRCATQPGELASLQCTGCPGRWR